MNGKREKKLKGATFSRWQKCQPWKSLLPMEFSGLMKESSNSMVLPVSVFIVRTKSRWTCLYKLWYVQNLMLDLNFAKGLHTYYGTNPNQ